MRNVAGFALTTASAFLAVVAVLIGAPALFYITTGLIATIAACHIQAYLSVRGLRVERIAPESARIGDLVTVEMTVWSERRIRRPLVTLHDRLPPRLRLVHLSPSLPIAPAYDLPVRSQYQLRPLRRGLYRWEGVIVEGTDALGLITKRKEYETAPAEMLVVPAPIPLAVELPTAGGWGISEAESGQTRGAGLDPWGIREYAPGDSLRSVHWRSTARTGRLLVREFEAGSHAVAAFLVQRSPGSDVGEGPMSSLDLMCGHVAFLAQVFLRQSARVQLLGLESGVSFASPAERETEILMALAGVEADSDRDLGSDLRQHGPLLPPGSAVFVLMAVPDHTVGPEVGRLRARGMQIVTLHYDAAFYHRSGRPLESAADPLFVENLRAAGSTPIVVPMEGGQRPT